MRFFFLLLLLLAFNFTSLAKENLKIGDFAPTFAVESTNGEVFDLQELKGKVVVLTFWSTRCQICVEEIPKLNHLAEEYKNRETVFLGLTNENQTKVESFLVKKPFVFNIIPSSFGVLLKYADTDKSGRLNMGFPAHFLINQNGEIVLKAVGFDKTDKLETEIQRLLH